MSCLTLPVWKVYHPNNKLPPCRILVVEDSETFRQFVCSKLEPGVELQVIGQASDGLEAVEKATELRPDLILLDIGLPKPNGMEVARQVRKLTPGTKILFLSQESDADFVREALRLGALGYVHKTRAQSDLLPAIDAVLGGRQFVSSGLKGWESNENTNTHASNVHEVQFYSNDAVLLARVTNFIAAALRGGNPAIVFATTSHQSSLLQRLKAQNVNVDAAIQQGTFVSIDAAERLGALIVNDWPDPVRFFESFSKLIESASKASMAEHPRVAIFGEGVALLCEEGKRDAAIRLEQLWNELANKYDVDILCAYPNSLRLQEDERSFLRICAEHSAIYSR